MAKKCIYCGCEIPEESVIDFCHQCGRSVWGDKMFETIVKNMESARSNGDLCMTNTGSTVKEISESERRFL